MIDGKDKTIQYIKADETNRHLLWQDSKQWGRYPAWIVKIDGIFAGSLEQPGSMWHVDLLFRHTTEGSYAAAKKAVRAYAQEARNRRQGKQLTPTPRPV